MIIFLDRTDAGTRNKNIDFDIESSPLQIRTHSPIGSGEVLWVRFLVLTTGPGLRISDKDLPEYEIGYCTGRVKFTMPGVDKARVWTFTKTAETLQLLCDGETIFDFNYAESSSSDDQCRNRWSSNFAQITFQSKRLIKDTASDSFRQLTPRKPLF